MKNGFTLIELLVVVLIIGILAAVALPQYEAAVEKSRMVTALPFLKSMKMQLELFYLDNGRYPTDLAEADLPGGCELSATGDKTALCGNKLKIVYNTPAGLVENGGGKVGWQLFLSNSSSRKDWTRCGGAESAVMHKVCKSMGGLIQPRTATDIFITSCLSGYVTTARSL